MPGRTVTAVLDANVTRYTAAMTRATVATKQFADKSFAAIDRNERGITSLSNKAGVLGLALGAGVAVAAKSYADFGSAVSSVAATGQDARQNLTRLSEAAIKAGADTKFSATEAAAGQEALAKANVSAADSLSGGLIGSLNLTAAGNLSVADSADLAATTMNQFGLAGKDIPHIADLIAASAGKAQGEVSDMGAALKQSGLVAAQTGLTLEETTGGLAAFASAGLIGSDAGTSFKTMLQALTPTSAEAKATMAQLGISAYDAQGNFIGLAEFADNLRAGLKGLSVEQQNAALKTIFGSDAVRAASVLYQQGGEGIRNWTDQVNDSGYASDVARIKMDNLRGDLELLSGSFETALIGLGEGSDGPLRSLVQNLTEGVNAFTELDSGTQSFFLALGAGVAVTALAAAGVGKLAVAANDARSAFKGLGISAKAAGFATVGVTAALGLAALAYSRHAEKAAEARQTTDDFVVALESQTDALQENLTAVATKRLEDTGALQAAQRYGLGLDVVTRASLGNAAAQAVVRARLDEVNGAVARMDGPARRHSSRNKELQEGYQALEEGVFGTSKAYADAVEKSKRVEEASKGAGDAAKAAAPGYSQSAGAIDKMAAESEAAQQALDDLVDSMFDAAEAAIGLSDAQIGYEQAVDNAAEAVKQNKRNTDLNTEAGRANREALNRLATSSHRYIEQLVAQDASTKRVEGATKNARAEFIKVAEKMGVSRDRAKELADKYGLIPEDVKTKVDAPGIDKTKGKVDDLKTAYDSFHDKDVALNLKLSSNYAAVKADFDLKFPQSRASGGPIQNLSGKGRRPYDTELAMLRVDEHVWTPEEVDAAGGHTAMHRMRQAALRGDLPAFATGGPVNRRLAIHAGANHPPDLINPTAWGRQAGNAMGAAAAAAFQSRISTAGKASAAAQDASVGGPVDRSGSFFGGVRPLASGSAKRHSGYGWASWAGDLNGPGDDYGMAVRAWKAGAVAATNYWNYSYGKHIRLNHPGGQKSLYAHLSKIGVSRGDSVLAGEVIGNVGDTGNSFGSHLHWEVQGGLARGGWVSGPGTSSSDSILKALSDGEFVVNAGASARNAAALEAINAGLLNVMPGYAAGGPVGKAQTIDIYALIRATQSPLYAIAAAVREVTRRNQAAAQARSRVAQADRTLDRAQADRTRAGRRVNQLEREANATKGVTQADRELKKAREDLERVDRVLEQREQQKARALDVSRDATDRAREAAQKLTEVQRDLAEAARQVSAQFAGEYKSTSIDARDWIELMRTGTTDLSRFTAKLTQLRKAGLSETLVQQIIGMGAIAGTTVATNIAAGGKGLVSQLNAANTGLQAAADALGYAAGIGRRRYAVGGPVSGPGSGTSDSVLIAASNGEWVVPEHAVAPNRPYLEAITYGRQVVSHNYARSHYATGGLVNARPLIDREELRRMVEELQPIVIEQHFEALNPYAAAAAAADRASATLSARGVG